MEVPSIHRNAQRRFERASTMKQSIVDLKDQVKAAKAEQKVRRFHGLRIMLESAIHPGRVDAHQVAQAAHETRQVTQAAKEREQKLQQLDHQVRSTVQDAHVLVGLARRASSGHVYAKHQADIMLNH